MPGLISRVVGIADAHRAKIELALAVVLYFLFACYLTWPMITDLAHTIYGAPGDPYGTMAFYRELVDHHHNPFLPGAISQLSAPEGQVIPWPRDLASLPGVLTMYLLTAVFGAITAFSLYTLLGYTLTGAITFLFARRLTGSTWAALIAGWAFAFYPFAVINGQGHLDFVQGWVLALGVWRMVELMWRPSLRNGVFAGLALVLAMWWSPYFILFGAVIYPVGTVVGIFVAWRQRRLRLALAPQAITACIVLVFLAFLGILSTAGVAEGIGERTQGVAELNAYSARPFEYVMPDINSPLFGKDTLPYIKSHLHGSNGSEATLYVGVTVILLALVALGLGLRRKLPPRVGSGTAMLGVIAVAAVLTSAPPEVRVFGTLVPFPSHFISQISSTWRVYSRFVIVVMLGLSLLAAVGLHALAGHRRLWLKVAIMLVASVAVPLDLWGRLVGRTNTLATPAVYKVLAREPAGDVAEYPLSPAGYNNYSDVFFQNAYNKPLMNGYLEGTFEEQRASSLVNLASSATARRLAALGVRYVILDAVPTGSGWPPSGKPDKGFRLLYHEPYADLYLVTARPSEPALPAVAEGFAATEFTPTGSFNWLERSSGTIELAGSCRVCKGMLSMTVTSFARPRTLLIYDADHRLLARRFIVAPTRLNVPLRFAGRATITVVAAPGPQSIHRTTGSPDMRSVSVQVGDLRFSALAQPK